MRIVPRVKKKSKNQIESESIKFLKRHFPEHLVRPGKLDVIEAFELLEDEYGLCPGVDDLSDGVEGMTWPDGRVMLSEDTYKGAIRGNGRSRFTVIHEIYHGLEHKDQIQRVLVDEGQVTLFRRSQLHPMVDPEWQADQFAARLLMPTERMIDVIIDGGTSTDVMYFFGVSQTAAKIRMEQVKQTLSYNTKLISNFVLKARSFI